ncbi:hypothetical protein PENTCL1PPCAC_25604 [Pristionchus entomophagus]|uniref:BUD13 homolog n=1 Tax=Pristionchus entomophagus TaxID=358040 RepID=A0AAV5UAP1_9BILA|nr:hypothetical protein PENTCL1PPCAC_25604 [Pristionchus entomophagus]
MSAALSRADYLKKYSAGGGGNDGTASKKKKKSKKALGAGMSIVEEDAFKAVGYGAKPELDSDMEEEIQIEAEIKSKIASTKAKFRNAFASADEPVVKKEPLSRSPSPVRRKRRDSDSPQRQRGDGSPPRRTRRDSDNSPPRAARKRRDSDNSPPSRVKKEKVSPRRKRRDSDASPPRRTRCDSDNSPPRATRRRRDLDASPPRRNRRDSDASPPRKRRNSDSSPPRRKERDLSPPRRKREASPNGERRPSSPKRIKEEPADEEDGQTRTLDGKKAGLQSAKDLREEGLMMKNREIEMFTNLASAISGRGAETVTRQKMTGKGKDNPEDKEKKEREAAKQAELDEKYKKNWNKGVTQQERRAAALEEAVRVAAEPWARTKDDEAMNDHLKDVLDMKEDPLAGFIVKKRQKIDIQKGRKVYPMYEGAWPPNRFSIPPGYRWDGVVRGNGFEGQLAIAGNAKKASEQEYYQNIQLYE